MVVTIGEPIAPSHVDGLCAGVRSALQTCEAPVVVCDLAGVTRPDAATVEMLARLALTSHRLGRRMCLRDAPAELVELIAFMGLAGVRGLVLEAQRQPEQRVEVLDVEEERDPADPIA